MVDNDNNNKPEKPHSIDDEFTDSVSRKAQRMETHRRQRARNPWFGLGFFGLIGWSISVPTLLGIWAGSALDNRFSGLPSWTLTCLLLGLIVGCVNAAYWIKTENSRRNDTDLREHK